MNDEIARLLPDFLMAQRWFGEKASPIQSIEIEDAATIGSIHHLIVAVHSTGQSTRYYVPLSVGVDGALADATHRPEYAHWLTALSRGDHSAALQNGQMIWETVYGLNAAASPIDGPSRVLAVEQSNTSIRFGDVALVKILRRLQSGANPEIELTKFLTERTTFTHAPALLGTLTYWPDEGEEFAVAVAQSFMPSLSDGWTAILADLADIQGAEGAARQAIVTASHGRIGVLGRRTAELHLAFASDIAIPEMTPQAITGVDVIQWTSSFNALLDRVATTLQREGGQDDDSSDLGKSFVASRARLSERSAGFERLIGVAKTRVHGDYHLGQTLLTHDHDWVLLDFEGEPRRTLAERRAKTSPLKDVAGMLRSFSYARGTAERAGAGRAVADLVAWERGARAAFLDGYVNAARPGKAGFLPASDEDFRVALAAWELDKAIYEIDYELNNRPDWLWLPLSAALKFG